MKAGGCLCMRVWRDSMRTRQVAQGAVFNGGSMRRGHRVRGRDTEQGVLKPFLAQSSWASLCRLSPCLSLIPVKQFSLLVTQFP